MNLKLPRKFSILLLAFLLVAGCTPAQTPVAGPGSVPSQVVDTQPPADPRMPPNTATVAPPATDRNYSDSFEMRFEGSAPWVYQLKTRNANGLREISLHMEGLPTKDNPGDIRLVTDGSTTWMNGKGTDNNCIQFPNNQGMDPTFIVPETLFSIQMNESQLGAPAEEEISGRKSLHYSANGLSQSGWTEIGIDAWKDALTGNLMRFNMQASGEDPFFGTGAGKVTASYEVVESVEGKIQQVKGCKIPVPLPSKVEAFVRLPEMASFESPTKPAKIVSFYQGALPKESWSEVDPPSKEGNTTILSYSKDGQEVEIQVTPRDAGGSKVKLLFVKQAGS